MKRLPPIPTCSDTPVPYTPPVRSQYQPRLATSWRVGRTPWPVGRQSRGLAGPSEAVLRRPEGRPRSRGMIIAENSLKLIGNTPLVLLKGPSEETGCEIWGKCEYANPGGSVKDRAALYIVRDRSEEHTSELQSLMRIS